MMFLCLRLENDVGMIKLSEPTRHMNNSTIELTNENFFINYTYSLFKSELIKMASATNIHLLRILDAGITIEASSSISIILITTNIHPRSFAYTPFIWSL